MARPWLRFHTPLIEPDLRIARIRLSDKTSRLRPRHVVPKPAQTYEPEVPVEVREWIRDHETVPNLLRRAHRFRAAEADGLLELSKEVTRLFIERVDVDAVITALALPKGRSKARLTQNPRKAGHAPSL